MFFGARSRSEHVFLEPDLGVSIYFGARSRSKHVFGARSRSSMFLEPDLGVACFWSQI